MKRSNIADVSKKKASLDAYQDKNAITEVLGCLIKNPQLLKTYPLRMEDFVDVFHRTLFSIIHNRVRDNATDIQPAEVEIYLKENYPVKYEMFTKHNGIKYMENAAELASLENFKMNYNTVRKWSLLRELVQSNIDVTEYFDPEDVITGEEAEAKRDKFENDSLETILAFYKSKFLSIANTFNPNANRDKKKAGGLESLEQVNLWKASPNFGLSYASQLLTTITYGLRSKRFTVMSAAPGTGKALPNYTFIPTPQGWKQVKDIKVGDYLFGENGKPTKVLAVHPQAEKKQIWKVYFEDGRVSECCGQHLWEYSKNNNPYQVADTETIYNEVINNFGLLKETSHECKYKIKLNQAVEYPEQKTECNPYLYGAYVAEELKEENSEIPSEFLINSKENRQALLQGLMDFSGDIDYINRCLYFTTNNFSLQKDFVELCRSLGYITYSYYKMINNGSKSEYKIGILCPENEAILMFRMHEKVEKVQKFVNSIYFKPFCPTLGITDIKCTDRYTEMTCFTVDNESHLFLCNDFIVTHNTRLSIANMCFSFAPYFWNSKTQAWQENPHGTSNSALYIGTEMELLEEVEPIIWAYMADVPEDHITQNQYEPGEEERVRQAIEYLRQKDEKGKEKNCGIFMEYVPEYDVDTLETIIEEYVTMHGVSAVFFDYIYSNPKLLAEYSAASKGNFAMREDQALSNLSTKLKELTRRYNISIDTCTQVSGDYKNADNMDETIVRGAKSIIDKCDVGMILSHPTPKEMGQLEPILHRGENLGKPEPNVCLTVYKNRDGKYNKVKVWLSVDYRTMRIHDLYVTNKEYAIVPVEKTRVIVDKTGTRHKFTSTEAMEEFRLGHISADVYNQVKSEEKADPSFRHKSRDDEKRLKQAEMDVSQTNLDSPTVVKVNDDFDDDDFDF